MQKPPSSYFICQEHKASYIASVFDWNFHKQICQIYVYVFEQQLGSTLHFWTSLLKTPLISISVVLHLIAFLLFEGFTIGCLTLTCITAKTYRRCQCLSIQFRAGFIYHRTKCWHSTLGSATLKSCCSNVVQPTMDNEFVSASQQTQDNPKH